MIHLDDSMYWIGLSAGALLLIGLPMLEVTGWMAALAAGSVIFLLRLAAIRWGIGLPKFMARE